MPLRQGELTSDTEVSLVIAEDSDRIKAPDTLAQPVTVRIVELARSGTNVRVS
jgi:hypothetical protein